MGNPSLPAADSQYEWTPKMISALERCKNDICYFAETFFTIVDKTKRHVIKLHDYQKKLLSSLSKNDRMILCCGRQIGKCFAHDSQVTLRHKWLPFISIKLRVSTFYKIQKFISKLKMAFCSRYCREQIKTKINYNFYRNFKKLH